MSIETLHKMRVREGEGEVEPPQMAYERKKQGPTRPQSDDASVTLWLYLGDATNDAGNKRFDESKGKLDLPGHSNVRVELNFCDEGLESSHRQLAVGARRHREVVIELIGDVAHQVGGAQLFANKAPQATRDHGRAREDLLDHLQSIQEAKETRRKKWIDMAMYTYQLLAVSATSARVTSLARVSAIFCSFCRSVMGSGLESSFSSSAKYCFSVLLAKFSVILTVLTCMNRLIPIIGLE